MLSISSLRSLVLGSVLAIGAHAQQQCTWHASGSGCGPTLSASFDAIGNHHQMLLSVANAFPSSMGVWVFGTQEWNWPIPGTSCFVFTNFVYGHPFVSRADGTDVLPHAWPNDRNGASMWVQVASIDRVTAELRTTNAVFVTCR